jgi:hypothetical protein
MRPRRCFLLVLVLLLSVESTDAQSLFSFIRILCPLLKAFGFELALCKFINSPTAPPAKSPPVKSPVKSPVASPKAQPPPPPPTSPVAIPAPSPPNVQPPQPTNPPVDAAPRAPMAQVPFAAPMVVPTRVEPPIVLSLPTPFFTLQTFPGKFNAVGSGPICIDLVNRLFSTVRADVTLRLNNAVIAISTLTTTQVCSASTLVNGINTIALAALDSGGFPLSYTTSVWAGSNTMTVNLVDGNGVKFTRETTVTAALSDDATVRATRVTATGSATLGNLPARTVIFTAITTGDSASSSGSVAGTGGTQSSVTLVLSGFLAPSTVVNNDLSLGTTAGWVATVPSTVSIVPHVETVGPKQRRRSLQLVNNDIELVTRRQQGETKLSRCFRSRPGSTGVLVRYRFVTEEIPDWFGSKYNDYFRVRFDQSRTPHARE